MSYICEICGKGTVVGRAIRHKRGVAGKRWKYRAQVTPRTFKPNLQKVTVVMGDSKAQMKLCTKCIKRLKIEGKIVTSKKKKTTK
jgi:large subunit ribosomal protein L28